MELTPEQIASVVEAAQEKIRERAIADAASALERVIQGAVYQTLHKEVSEFLAAEIAPAIRERLTTEKPLLIEAALKGAHASVQVIADAMVAQVTKTMATEWDRSEALKRLFGGR